MLTYEAADTLGRLLLVRLARRPRDPGTASDLSREQALQAA